MTFDEATAIAERVPDIQEYDAWKVTQEMRYERMPHWYWNELTCRAQYAGYVQKAMDWYEAQAAANDAAIGFGKVMRGERS